MNDLGTTPEVGEYVWWVSGECMAEVRRVTSYGELIIVPLEGVGLPITTRACFLRRYEP